MVHVCGDHLLYVYRAESNAVGVCLLWAHSAEWSVIPSFTPLEISSLFASHKPLWMAVNTHVTLNGPIPPIKLFRHGFQVFCSKRKDGIDGVTQYRSILRASITSVGWEQKVVIQTCKTLLIHPYNSWRFVEWSAHNGDRQLDSLDKFRSTFNEMEPFGYFVALVATELLTYGNILTASSTTRLASTGGAVSRGANSATIRRLKVQIAKNQHRWMPFFNDPGGVLIRLRIHMHQPIELRAPRWCALCGTFNNRATGHFSTNNYCSIFTIHLCTKAMDDGEKSCWHIWPSQETCNPPAPTQMRDKKMLPKNIPASVRPLLPLLCVI